MKVEHQPANNPSYYIMDANMNIRQNLSQTVVIEFPTFHVVLPEHLPSYKIMKHGQGIITQGSENVYLFKSEDLGITNLAPSPDEDISDYIKLEPELIPDKNIAEINPELFHKNILECLQAALEKDGLVTEDKSSTLPEETTTNVIETTNRVESTNLIETANRVESTNLIETTNRVESTNLIESTNRVESTNLIETANRVESTNLIESANRVESTNLVESANRVESTNLIEIASNMNPAEAR